ncbi:solute carrier family 52, riboflavin transporter, member 3-A-like [Oppia nitens]|uniref:solute carrier family 52, riboflavin transporter, member 3-A-like n=1 Tax=Oppia nitens TaxID=1686743 RepID=UPI0023DB7DDA|nr:solute carrier family 52, riboflavin transporter, member 3-A-like [Oppia nitens]
MSGLSVKLLSLLFGLGSWVAVTGLWLEIPVLIQHLPEGWSLASDLNFVIQLANIGPVFYYFLRKYGFLNETKASHGLLAVGTLSCLLLMTSWKRTFRLFSRERSVPLFVSTFGLSLLDTTSSVTFLPFMSRFDRKYLTFYLIGEGLSGFIPTIFASIQGIQETDENCDQNSTQTQIKTSRNP